MNNCYTSTTTVTNRRQSPRIAAATAVAAATALRNGCGFVDSLLISSAISRTTSPYFSPSRIFQTQQQEEKEKEVTPSCFSFSDRNSNNNSIHNNETKGAHLSVDEKVNHHMSISKPSLHRKSCPKKKKSVNRREKRKTQTKSVSLPASDAARTTSFEPLWYGSKNFQYSCLTSTDGEVNTEWPPIHTLILGTHPSITSLSRTQYFGHDQNAFWWIVGDCLKFRRSEGISAATKKPFALCRHLRYDNILPYDEQVLRLCSHGFALWDVVGSCSRLGSLDSNIRQEIPNNVKGFCQSHPSIRRIVFANGGTGCAMFYKHNKSWWDDDVIDENNVSTQDEDSSINKIVLLPGPNVESQKAFSRYVYRRDKYCGMVQRQQHQFIECISALSVSPAAAVYSYEAKRNHWEKYCFQPGLEDLEKWKKGNM